MRASKTQKELIGRAAAETGQSVTDFVLQTAVERARNVLADQRVFRMNDEEWAWFQEFLDTPPREIPGLRELLAEPSIFRGE